MRLGKNLQDISDDAKEYIKRSIDGYRLQFVENLSALMGDMVCHFVTFMLLFIAFLFLLVAMVFFVAEYMGYIIAMLAAAKFLAVAAWLLYIFREKLFTDWFVKRIIRIVFQETEDEK